MILAPSECSVPTPKGQKASNMSKGEMFIASFGIALVLALLIAMIAG